MTLLSLAGTNKKDLDQEIEKDTHLQVVHHPLPLEKEDTIKNITEKEEEALHHHLQALRAEVVIAAVAVTPLQTAIRGKADQGQEIKGGASGTSDYYFKL